MCWVIAIVVGFSFTSIEVPLNWSADHNGYMHLRVVRKFSLLITVSLMASLTFPQSISLLVCVSWSYFGMIALSIFWVGYRQLRLIPFRFITLSLAPQPINHHFQFHFHHLRKFQLAKQLVTYIHTQLDGKAN